MDVYKINSLKRGEQHPWSPSDSQHNPEARLEPRVQAYVQNIVQRIARMSKDAQTSELRLNGRTYHKDETRSTAESERVGAEAVVAAGGEPAVQQQARAEERSDATNMESLDCREKN